VSVIIVMFDKRIILGFTIVCIAVVLLYVNYSDENQFVGCPDCNVILISVDPLRADHLGCYGYERDTSPNIDRLASEGILFENSFSNAYYTMPSLFSMITSQYPLVHGFKFYEMPGQNVSKPEFTMTGVMKIYGYKTIGFTRYFWFEGGSGFEKDFDEYHNNFTFNLVSEEGDNRYKGILITNVRNRFL